MEWRDPCGKCGISIVPRSMTMYCKCHYKLKMACNDIKFCNNCMENAPHYSGKMNGSIVSWDVMMQVWNKSYDQFPCKVVRLSYDGKDADSYNNRLYCRGRFWKMFNLFKWNSLFSIFYYGLVPQFFVIIWLLWLWIFLSQKCWVRQSEKN